MKMQYTAIPFAIVLLIGCSQSEPKEQQDFNSGQIASEITQMLNDYHAAIKKDGLMAEFKYLDSSPDFFWVPPGYQSALSYDSVRTILEANAKANVAIILSWDTLQIFPLSNTLATYSGIVNGAFTDTAHHTTRISMIESGTLIRREDGWKLLCGQSAVLQ
jgi:hypothetical protein